MFGKAQQVHHLFLVLKVVEQFPDTVDIIDMGSLVNQVGPAPHDQGPFAVAVIVRPDRKACLADPGRQRIQFLLNELQLASQLLLEFADRQALAAAVQKIADFRQR